MMVRIHQLYFDSLLEPILIVKSKSPKGQNHDFIFLIFSRLYTLTHYLIP